MFLQLRSVHFSYENKGQNGKGVINDISFSAAKGQTIAIVGASGSGKSTILRVISGILPKHNQGKLSGETLINGQAPADYIKEGKLSFMFQQPALFPNLSVEDNIALPLKINNQLDNSKVRKLIDVVGLRGYEHYLPESLSGGMRTRVSLARSFVTDPELLLLDEPFSSLDVAWKDVLYQELKQLVGCLGTTTVLVTHDIEEAIKLADTIICLGTNGQIIFKQTNTKTEELYSVIESIIINDHKLRNEYEKDFVVSVG